MVFSAPTFVFFFLPAVIVLYRLLPRVGRNGLLLLASLFFYTWGAGGFVLALIGSIAGNYLIGRRIERAMDHERPDVARRWLALGAFANVALLAWFKYSNFGVASWNAMLGAAGVPSIPWIPVVLPIGISFFTFHALSYLIDVYRRTARNLLSPIDFGLYIAFFPQLIAGPIIRFHEIRDQFLDRRETLDAFAAGVYRFALGLGKKVIVADTVAPIANAAFGTPTGDLSTGPALLGVVAYTVQLYFDFSGYSDMAIGLALMFGFHFPENFARPYASRSITEFWRRWHMSLSRWFRDYLYIPLGGNRGSALATCRNLVTVFLITGLWHGANWTFVAWGAYHGTLLLIERVFGVGRGPEPRARIWQAVTVGLVMFGWILFRSPTLDYAAGYIGALLRPMGAVPLTIRLAAEPLALAALVFGAASALIPAAWVTGVRIQNPLRRAEWVLRYAMVVIVLPVALGLVLAGNFSPFLYFQF
ncbi:MAG TPA: MBOAT family protein [Candidatus Limnocylindrales bacterium]